MVEYTDTINVNKIYRNSMSSLSEGVYEGPPYGRGQAGVGNLDKKDGSPRGINCKIFWGFCFFREEINVGLEFAESFGLSRIAQFSLRICRIFFG